MSDPIWLQLSLETGRFATEQLEDALLAAGALAVTLQDAADQPLLEPAPGTTPLWRRTRVTGLFDAQIDIAALRECLRRTLGELPPCRLEALEDRDWVRAWLDDFKPLRFGNRLWVVPSAYQPPEPEAVNLFLDPGLAFGTGSHPTTALCLEWLDGADATGKTVLDYGCGSGILAIAAAKLGARAVYAVDIDPQALSACIRNAERNAVNIVVSEPQALALSTADIVLANILAGPLIELAPRIAELLRRGGELALSGLLDDQANAVEAAYAPWFSFTARRRHEHWSLLVANRLQ